MREYIKSDAGDIDEGLNIDLLMQIEQREPGQVSYLDAGMNLKRKMAGGQSALLDSTTFKNATGLIGGERLRINPYRLFDLVTFVKSVVLFDRVYVLPGANLEPAKRALGGSQSVFEPVFEQPKDINQKSYEDVYMYHRYMDLVRYMIHLPANEEAILIQCWKDLLGDDLAFFEFRWERADAWKRTPLGFYATFDHDFDFYELSEFISLSTFRTFYAHDLSHQLGIIYLPNSARGPVERYLLEKQEENRNKLVELIQGMEKTFDTTVEKFVESAPFYAQSSLKYRSPMFFAAIMKRAKDLDDFYDLLAEMRQRAQPLRSKIREWRQALENGDLVGIEKLNSEMNAGIDSLDHLFGDLDVRESLRPVSSLPPWSEPATTILRAIADIAGLLDTEHTRKLYARIRFPHVYFLNNIKNDANQLLSVEGAVRKLWGGEEGFDPSFFQRILKQYPV